MFGFVHNAFRQLCIRKYGKEVWTQICTAAMMEEESASILNRTYTDQDSFRLVASMSNVVGIPVDEVWEGYGAFLMQFLMETGWDELLRAMAHDLQGFLDNLDALHYFIDHVVYNNQLIGPSFHSTANDDGSLTLHYHSKRSGLYPIVKGVVREVSRRLFDYEVVMRVQERKQEELDNGQMAEHVVFNISIMDQSGAGKAQANSARSEGGTQSQPQPSGQPHNVLLTKTGSLFNEYPGTREMQKDISYLSLFDFARSFPYHMCFNKHLVIEHVGVAIKQRFPFITPLSTKLTDLCELVHPDAQLNYDNLIRYINGVFVVKLRESSTVCMHETPRHGQVSSRSSTASDASDGIAPLSLKGQIALTCGGEYIMYLASPDVYTVRGLIDRKMYLSDIPMHDTVRELILLNQSRISQQDINKKLEAATEKMKEMTEEVNREKEKTNDLLKQLLPPTVAEALQNGTTVAACEFETCTIVFTDIVSFTTISSGCTPHDVIYLLDNLYNRFDRLVGLNDLYKVETVGDAYMAVAGVPDKEDLHAEKVLNMAIGMQWESRQVIKPDKSGPIRIRCGVHTGPIVAGVVGKKMPRYCLFGDTSSIAGQMECKGHPTKIHVSATTYECAISRNKMMFEFEPHNEISIGSGYPPMQTHWLLKNNGKSLWELIDRPKGEMNTIDGYKELLDVSVYAEIDPTAPTHKETKEPPTKRRTTIRKPRAQPSTEASSSTGPQSTTVTKTCTVQ